MSDQIVYVPVECADGLFLVPHTREELERLWDGWEPEFEALEEPSCP